MKFTIFLQFNFFFLFLNLKYCKLPQIAEAPLPKNLFHLRPEKSIKSPHETGFVLANSRVKLSQAIGTHTRRNPFYIVPNLDCNYTFPIDLAQMGFRLVQNLYRKRFKIWFNFVYWNELITYCKLGVKIKCYHT